MAIYSADNPKHAISTGGRGICQLSSFSLSHSPVSPCSSHTASLSSSSQDMYPYHHSDLHPPVIPGSSDAAAHNPREFFFSELFGGSAENPDTLHRFCEFLQRVDDYLQYLTLMVSPLVPENPGVTTHKYRPLECAKLFRYGSGTVLDPFRVELPAYALEGEWIQRFRGGQRQISEAVLTPEAGFHEAAPENHEVMSPCFVAGPACMQAKDWVRKKGTNKVLRVQYSWPSQRLKQFCEPGRTLMTQTIKGSGMDNYKMGLGDTYVVSLFQHNRQEYQQNCQLPRSVTWTLKFWHLDETRNLDAGKLMFVLELQYTLDFLRPSPYEPTSRGEGHFRVMPTEGGRSLSLEW
ncbi:hypothetical protein RHOSPDRAFT_27465 [Rhodotorula sp. JG-1b]|nr:hypothetical protein RHOSPDRAFT_27465 [Rhodotorula sp. JG-1b]